MGIDPQGNPIQLWEPGGCDPHWWVWPLDL